MSERETPYDKQQFSRRSFLKGAAFLAGAYTLRGNGITFASPLIDRFHQGSSDAENYHDLSSYQPLTIAHRAGDSIEGIINAAKIGIDYAELDVSKSGGNLYANHGLDIDVPLINVIPFGVDEYKFRLGPPPLTLEGAFQTASDARIGLFLELKRTGLFRDFNEHDIARIYGLSKKNRVDIMMHSENFGRIDMAKRVMMRLDPENFDSDKYIYVPKGEHKWQTFFDEQEKYPRTAVLADPQSISENQNKLADFRIRIYATNVNSPSTALALCHAGVRDFFSSTRNLKYLFRQDAQARSKN